MKRTEIEKPLTEEEFDELSNMVVGNVINKRRYILPLKDYPDLKVELDIFSGIFEGLIIAEVEFPDTEIARSFKAPDYLKFDVTDNPKYQNSSLSLMNATEVSELLSASKLI
jgi:CYTH domain-containing protein